MQQADKNQKQAKTGSTDSFLGMALAGAFMGMVFGPGVEQIWDAGETLSAVYEDRCDQKRTNGRGVFELGKKKSLADSFTRMAENTIAELDRMSFRPSYDSKLALAL